ncbi:MAG TPA: nucleotidyltransferase domain-containing protein [Blastocatellia bacterium]|nr:nucleotidyltransferase domain-containing protein [Blastocatellia bacterium]
MRSSDSVEIEYFPDREVWEELRAFAAQLRRQHPEIEKVLVFGSLVRGDCVPGSDVDLLVVLRESNVSFLERIPQYTPSNFPVAVDVFPYTCEELEHMLREGNTFIQEALAEGIEVPSEGGSRADEAS